MVHLLLHTKKALFFWQKISNKEIHMLLAPGTILIAALPYYARLIIVGLLGTITMAAIFFPHFFTQPNIPIALSTCLLVYFSMSTSNLTRKRVKELSQYLNNFDPTTVIKLSYNDSEFNRSPIILMHFYAHSAAENTYCKAARKKLATQQRSCKTHPMR